ncbi:MAG: hypothetical protein WDM79_05235 [Terricaulis sp.]
MSNTITKRVGALVKARLAAAAACGSNTPVSKRPLPGCAAALSSASLHCAIEMPSGDRKSRPSFCDTAAASLKIASNTRSWPSLARQTGLV